MDTDALIRLLARDASPVPRRPVARGLAVSLTLGAAAAMILGLGGLGVRSDIAVAVATTSFWAKSAWTLSIAGIGLLLTAQLARPDSHRITRWWLSLIPLSAILALAGLELIQAAVPARAGLVFGPLWTCPPQILMLSVPIFLSLASALQQMAPTRLRLAGAAAGLAAGGLAATVFSIACQEVSPTYIFTRYSLAIALASAAGGLLGPRLLRW